jgi:EmrB/QacA subfamily drug resistance transporter
MHPPIGRRVRPAKKVVSFERLPSPTGPSSPGQRRGPDPRRWQALAVSLVAGFMSLLDVSIVNVTLPSMERDLGASPATLQWVVSGYALALGLTLVPAGRLGDMVGRRRMFLIALTAFVVTSALAGAAPSAGLLVTARLLQGAAGGMLLPQNSALIQDLFRGDERGRAFGIFGAVTGLATAAGPVVGGVIMTTSPGPDVWLWVVSVNVRIGVVALALAARLLRPAAKDPTRGRQLDVVGSMLLGGGMLSLLLPLVDASSGGLTRLWPLFGVAGALLTLFAWWEIRTERRGRQPVLDPALLSVSGFSSGVCIGLVYNMGSIGVWLVLALFFQDGLGYSPLCAGLAMTPYALGMAASALIAGRLVARIGRWLTVFGLTASAVGMVSSALVLSRVAEDAAMWATAGPLLVAGLGGGMVASPNTTLTLQFVPVRMAGEAGGALQTARRMGSAIGAAGLVTIYYRSLTSSGHDYATAVSDALLVGTGFVLLALLMGLIDVIRRRRCPPHHPVSRPRTENQLEHV